MKKLLVVIFIPLLIIGLFGSISAINDDYEEVLAEIEDIYQQIPDADEQTRVEMMENIMTTAENLVEEFPHSARVHWEAAKSYGHYNYFAEPENAEEILEQGVEYAEKAIELDPESGKAYFWKAANLGDLAQERGILASLASVDPIKENLEKTMELSPDFAPAYDVMARLYMEAPGWPLSIGDEEKSLEYRKKSIQLAPEASTYRWRLYETYLELGEEEKAEEVLEDIIAMPAENNLVREDVEEIKRRAEENL